MWLGVCVCMCVWKCYKDKPRNVCYDGGIRGKPEKIPIQSGKQYNAEVYTKRTMPNQLCVYRSGVYMNVDSDYMCRCHLKLLSIEIKPQPFYAYILRLHTRRIYNALSGLLPFSISHRIHCEQTELLAINLFLFGRVWVAKNKTTRMTNGFSIYKSGFVWLCGRKHESTAEQSKFPFFIT